MRNSASHTQNRWLSLLLVAVLLAPMVLGCTRPGAGPAATVTPISSLAAPNGAGNSPVSAAQVISRVGSARGMVQGGSSGMTFTLSEGVDAPPPPETVRLVAGQELSAARSRPSSTACPP